MATNRDTPMTEDFTLANAKLVLPGEIVDGSLQVRGGQIVALSQGTSVPAGALDCEGDFVAPGLIELHTDNLERHIHPRPMVDWPHHAAIVAHDAELAGAGITTVFDALRVGSIVTDTKFGYRRYARQLADEILAMRDAEALRISHHLHLRAEICSETLVDELHEFGLADRVGIVSLMDHTPGQRQFADLSKYETYVRSKYPVSAEAFAAHVQHLRCLQEELGARHEAEAVAAARRYGATLASHDDGTVDQVVHSEGQGVRLAEFPTTIAAAEASRNAGIAVIMGAPNLVRGGSHSGNVSATELARHGLLDILSSDYVPAALLMGAVSLGRIWDNFARGLATVTANPAEAVGLTDRGALAEGLRADLVRFRLSDEIPILRGVWSSGARVA